MSGLLLTLKRQIPPGSRRLQHRLLRWVRPLHHPFLGGTLADVARTTSALLAEQALLRQHLLMLRRQGQRPWCTKTDRLLLVVLARAACSWKQALLSVQPDTLLGWHRHRFRWSWRGRSQSAWRNPPIAPQTSTVIQTMARDHRLWGAVRMRGERLTLGIPRSKRPMQQDLRVHRAHPAAQTWGTC